MRCVLLLGVVLTVLTALPLPAHAQVEPAQVALVAEDAHSRHCSDVASRGTSDAAAANTEVSVVWEQVSRAFEESGVAYLRYWRGVLGQCIGHEQRAADDYAAFLAESTAPDTPPRAMAT